MIRRCTFRDPDTHRRCTGRATHAVIPTTPDRQVWGIYDATWPGVHAATHCLADAIGEADGRTQRAEEAADAG